MARVCCLIFLLLLSCLLLAEAGKRDRGERVRIRKKPKGGQCERIKENLCIGSGLPYNRTRLPNVFGHNKQKLVGRALQEYRSVVESGCSPYIRAFLCASFLPECPRRKRQDPLQPCRSLCENVSHFKSKVCKLKKVRFGSKAKAIYPTYLLLQLDMILCFTCLCL